MIDWSSVGFWTSSGKYFMHVQDENKLTINTIGRSCNWGHSGWLSGKFGPPLKMRIYWILRGRNFALQHAPYGSLKERGTIFTRGIEFNVPILTGRDCKRVHPAQPNGRPTLASVLLSDEDLVTIFLFLSHRGKRGVGVSMTHDMWYLSIIIGVTV